MEQAAEDSLKILHVEDDPLDARLIEVRLNMLGFKHKTTRVMTTAAFRAELEKNQADVVLSDSGLSTFDVFEALAFVREKHPGTPFIFLSGNASPELQGKARAQGAFDYVVKANLWQLPKTVRRACANMERANAPVVIPRFHQNVVVRCPGYQCMAYLDPDGTWRDHRTAKELPDVLAWFAP